MTPADIRWMLALTAPRVNAPMAYYYRQAEVDDALVARSKAVLKKAGVLIEVRLPRALDKNGKVALKAAPMKYGAYFGMPVELTVLPARRGGGGHRPPEGAPRKP